MSSVVRFLLPFPVVILAAALLLVNSEVGAQTPGTDPPLPAVVVESIKVREVSDPTSFTARVEAIEAVDIRARVQGFLRALAFSDGQVVREGDLLFEIEPDQYEAEVASAQAQVARAEATRVATERTLARNQELRQSQTVAEATLTRPGPISISPSPTLKPPGPPCAAPS